MILLAMVATPLEVWPIDRVYPFAERREWVSEECIVRCIAGLKRGGVWQSPLFVDPFGSIIEGTCLYLAAKRMGLDEVPVVVVGGVTQCS